MSIYIMLTNLTDEGRRTIREDPERIKKVNREVEAMGIKILAQYALLGPYDFLNILEATSDKAISKVSVELGARGTLQPMTMAAIDIDEFISSFK
ncbi:GYD domain-containing protein [Chloroflexota bacterium]